MANILEIIGVFSFPLEFIIISNALFFRNKDYKLNKFSIIYSLIFILISALFIFGGFFLTNYFNIEGFLKIIILAFTYLLVFLSFIVLNKLIFKDFKYSILISIVTYINQHITYNISKIIFLIIFQKELDVYSPFYYITVSIIYILYIILSIFILSKLMKRFRWRQHNFKWIIVSSIALLFIIIFNLIANSYALNEDRLLIYIYDLLGTLILFILLYFCGKIDISEEEINLIKTLNEVQKKHYELSKDNINNLNIKYHDLKHQINALKKGAYDQEEIEKIEDSLKIYDSIYHTGNDALDAVLNEKSLYSTTNNINFTALIDASKLNFLKNGEIYSLFGNLLDNAIEAVNKIDNKEEKIISLEIKNNDNFLIISLENYTNNLIKFDNGLPLTNKKDKENHRFGTKSIQLIVNEHNGELIFKQKNIFKTTIIFPL